MPKPRIASARASSKNTRRRVSSTQPRAFVSDNLTRTGSGLLTPLFSITWHVSGQGVLDGPRGHRRPRLGAEFCKDPPQMAIDRAVADAQQSCDLPVCQPL